jgi:hypothetical protein
MPGDHALELAPGWRLWRLAALRGAGMPASWLTRLAETDQPGPALRGLLLEPRFLSALTWQNPALVDNWVARHADELRAGRGQSLGRRAQREALLAGYAQRYCAKNETIGAFGPVAWARFEETAAGLRSVGGGGVRRRSVHLEVWAVDALAAAWSRDPRLLPHLPARLDPAATLEGLLLRLPRRRPRPIPEPDAAVLALADGRPVREIVGQIPGAAEVLERWRREGAVTLGFLVPIDEHPERHLRRQVEAVPDEPLRRRLLAELDGLEAARDAVAAADGSTQLRAALDRLARRFTDLTGQPAGRGREEVRYGRTVAYEDCRRDLDVTIGADLLDRLRKPLALVLESARWLVGEVAEAVQGELVLVLKRLESRTGEGGVRLDAVLIAAAGILAGAPESPVHEVVDDFQGRWAELLPGDGDAHVRLDPDAVEPTVRALFPPNRPGWAAARQHSPDLLLVPEQPLWVLGELHLALNTLENRVFHTQADRREELTAATAADMAAGRVVPLYPKRMPEVTSRTYPPLAAHVPGYLYWSFDRDDGHPEAGAGLPATAIKVRVEAGEPVAGPVDGAWTAPLLEVLGEFLTALVVNRFQLRRPSPHAPRVAIGDLVVARESWRMAAAGLPDDPGELAAALAAQGLPEVVFARTAAESKPFLVDLRVPPLVANLARAARRARATPEAHLDVVEALPGLGQLWLEDRDGERYTAELRAVVVDTRERPPPLRRA